MDEIGYEANDGDKRIVARSVDKLPELGEDQVRVVHFTSARNAEEILKTGLSYKDQGMAMSTAMAFGNPNEVVYCSDDPRFNHSKIKIVVMDMSNLEWKDHNHMPTAPGRISKDKIVGIVDIVLNK